jgi:UDP-glucose 4-epimerase
MNTILVTGAYGFLGRHVCQVAAASGGRVAGIGHGAWTEAEARVWGLSAWHKSDVTAEALARLARSPDVIIHCAGSGSAAPALREPGKDFARTVGSTVGVLEFIRSHSPRTVLVYPSSGAVYGIPPHVPVAEGDPTAPITPYGAHKRVAEEMIESYARHFGVRTAVVRIFSLYGPELRKQLLWDACVKATRGNITFAGTGTETRDWVAVEDAASLLLLAATRAGTDAPVVNCATGIETSMRDLLSVLFASLGTPQKPIFTGERRSVDPVRYAGDPTRALSWDWQPKRQWQEGIADYACWFQNFWAQVK